MSACVPPVRTAADLPRALADVATAVASGKLTPEEGQAVAAVLEVQRCHILAML
jgi:hypothetical protein